MNFAKNILSKYGWKEGDGLGKEKQGIKKPIKANLKFDQAGLGADPSKEFNNNWWERAFNDAAKNVQVKKESNGEVSVDLKDAQSEVEITTKGYSIKKLAESGTMYGQNFMSEDVAFSSFAVTECKILSDEELFRACGGRTAHKGARHGLKLSGKLARLEQQEKELLAKMQSKMASKQTDDNTKAFTEVIKNGSKSGSQKSSKRKHKDFKDDCSSEKIIKISQTKPDEPENSSVVKSSSKSSKTEASFSNDNNQIDLIKNAGANISKSDKSKKKKKKKHLHKNE